MVVCLTTSIDRKCEVMEGGWFSAFGDLVGWWDIKFQEQEGTGRIHFWITVKVIVLVGVGCIFVPTLTVERPPR